MYVLEAAAMSAALIYYKKMTGGAPEGGSYGVSEGGQNTHHPSEIEIMTIENTAQITAGSSYTLSNSSFFSPTILQTSQRDFTNLTLVNLSACPIDIQLEGNPRKYFTLTASSEFTMTGSRILKFKNLTIKNRSNLAAIEANQLVLTLW
jgi:hypothetical protein